MTYDDFKRLTSLAIMFAAALQLLWTSPALAIRNGVAESGAAYLGVGEITPTAGHAMCTATLISRNAVLTSAN